MSAQPRNLLLTASKVTYGICLFVPAYATGHIVLDDWHWGLEAFLMGPIGFFDQHWSWFANPFIWSAWRQLDIENYSLALIRAAIALALALTFNFQTKIVVFSAGAFSYTPHIGYYLWLFSIFLTCLAAVGYEMRTRKGS